MMGRVGGDDGGCFSFCGVRVCMALLTLFIASCCLNYDGLIPVATAAAHDSHGIVDGSHFYCYRGFKQCTSGIRQCIRPDQECDGVPDCSDGSDEGHQCQSFDCIAAGRYRCPSGNGCMNVTDSDGNWRYHYKDPYAFYLCDGVRDCRDGSDEAAHFCSSCAAPPHTTIPVTLGWDRPPSRRVRCPSGKGCVLQDQLCDGVVQCRADGGSDESDRFCKGRRCSENIPTIDGLLFQCRSGRCIHRSQMCDGKVDCPNGDDEGRWCETADCPVDRIRCPNGSNRTCPIEFTQICDGVRDCPRGTDEIACRTADCPRCPSGNTCLWGLPCDGKRDCRDGSDESSAFCRSYVCEGDDNDEKVKCKDGIQCIYRNSQCDMIKDCIDGSDEDPSFCRRQPCTNNFQVKCPGPSQACIQLVNLCDGTRDCFDNSDENSTYCASNTAYNLINPTGRIRCDSNPALYFYGIYCDGVRNCADGSDEKPSFCATFQCSEGYVNCGTVCRVGTRCDGHPDCPNRSDEAHCPT